MYGDFQRQTKQREQNKRKKTKNIEEKKIVYDMRRCDHSDSVLFERGTNIDKKVFELKNVYLGKMKKTNLKIE